MKKHLWMWMLGLVAMGCSSNEEPGVDGGEQQVGQAVAVELTADEAAASNATDEFQYRFFNKSVELAEANDNVLVSPLSTRVLLSMVANAVDDETRAEIVEALDCNNVAALNSLSGKLTAGLPEVDKNATTMKMAQSVWHDSNYQLAPAFSEVLAGSFGADTYSRNMSMNEAVKDEVNRWCSDHTEGMIPQFIDRLPDNVVAMLCNAMYFKGNWALKFDKANTTVKTFAGTQKEKSVSMMKQTMPCRYMETSSFTAAEVKFGNATFDAGYMAIFVLPAEGVSTETVASQLNAETFKHMVATSVSLSLPRISLDQSRFSLEGVLRGLGINKLYENRQQKLFTQAYEGLWQTYQGASVKFDESGAEAAAVSIAVGWNTFNPSQVQVMELNRPFIFFIKEVSTGAVLLAGKVANL